MKTIFKALVISTAPMLLAAANSPPTTQPATQPSTQPATQPLVQSLDPIVLPDGTSLQNPGPTAPHPHVGGGGVGGARL